MHLTATDRRHVEERVEAIQRVARSVDIIRIELGAVKLETLADLLDETLHPGRFLRASFEKQSGEGSHGFQIDIAAAAQGQLERGQPFPVACVDLSPPLEQQTRILNSVRVGGGMQWRTDGGAVTVEIGAKLQQDINAALTTA